MGGGQVLSAVLVVGIVGTTGSALFGEHGLRHLLRLHAEQRELAQATFTLLERNARLRDEILRFRTDDLYLEELGRRQLGLVKPNETVYRFRKPAD
jgi:cell division protein FtsB